MLKKTELNSSLEGFQPMGAGGRFINRLKARWGQFKTNWAVFRQRPMGIIGLAIILGFMLMTLAHPILMRTVWPRRLYHPQLGFDMDITPHPTLPGEGHLLGTDSFGRDVFSQLLYGAQASFSVGIIAALIAVTLSTLLGSAAGFFGGLLDTIIMTMADVFVLLPAPIVLLIFGLLFKMEIPVLGVLYGLMTGLGGQAIVVKSYTLNTKVRPYVDAARVVGGGKIHIWFRHIIPSLMPLALVHAVFTVVGAVLTESLLSFYSRTQADMSWGTMIWLGQRTFRWFTLEGQWHAIAPPAISIMLFCSAFYLVGRALDEIVNPRLRKR